MQDRKNSSLLRRLEKFQRLFFVALLSVLAVGVDDLLKFVHQAHVYTTSRVYLL